MQISDPAAIRRMFTDLYSIKDMKTLAIHAEFLPSACIQIKINEYSPQIDTKTIKYNSLHPAETVRNWRNVRLRRARLEPVPLKQYNNLINLVILYKYYYYRYLNRFKDIHVIGVAYRKMRAQNK